MMFWIFVFATLCFLPVNSNDNRRHTHLLETMNSTQYESIKQRLDVAISEFQNSISKILAEYQADKLPKAFLGGMGMPETSWSLLVKRLYSRLMTGVLKGSSDPFVIAFLGSSVTAGHDNFFNLSTTEVLRELMTTPLQSANLGVQVIVRNQALGGIQCFPYDICASTFTGQDVDILQWEQTYFCFNDKATWAAEGMIRAALQTPGSPLVVFADSSTGPYKKEECEKVDTTGWETKHKDKSYIGKSVRDVVTVANSDLYTANGNKRGWGWVTNKLLSHYRQAGIEVFDHTVHQREGKCLGPYVPSFNEGALSWHPSILGHKLRASRYAYVWLGAFLEAAEKIKQDIMVLADAKAAGEKQIALFNEKFNNISRAVHKFKKQQHWKEPSQLPKKLLYEWEYTHRCYTNFEPRHVRDMSLQSLRYATPPPDQDPWKLIPNVAIAKPHILDIATKQGYLDFKVSYIGNNSSGPLTFEVELQRNGQQIIICEAPPIFGVPPPTCEALAKAMPKIYLHPPGSLVLSSNSTSVAATAAGRRLQGSAVHQTHTAHHSPSISAAFESPQVAAPYPTPMNTMSASTWTVAMEQIKKALVPENELKFHEPPAEHAGLEKQCIRSGAGAVTTGKHAISILPSSEKNIVLAFILVP